MEPLQSIPVATHGVVVAIDNTNSWRVTADRHTLRLAYIASDSKQPLSFVSLQSATHAANVLRLASRPTNFEDMPYGVVVEVYLAHDLANGEAVRLALAHAGASIYYPPQQIDDFK